HLTGRRKNIFITSFGRNVSPEWVESALSATPEIEQVWVHGEARPWNAAVITPAPGCDSPAVDAAVARVNRTLPDYARIGAWIRSERPFSYDTGELTVNGRLRREALLARYRAHLERLYKVNPAHVL
ncbi:MAG TPA: long-chain acyl-CoA synthetase, partial [Burkholderiales bacterium]|nr:long-chain acyl-CoA synthetase [Burkholderiales bacterium]